MMTKNAHSRARRFVSFLLAAAVLASVHALGAETEASREQLREFNIRSQDAAPALVEFAEQAGVQVAMKADSVRGLTAHTVIGNYSPQQALNVLIAGLHLQAHWVTEKTVAISAQPRPRETTEVPLDSIQKGSDAIHADVKIDEVVVTARRREERLQSVPVTISAFNSEALRQASIEQTSDLMMKVPGVFLLGSNNRENPVYVIRGQSKALSGAGAPAVVSYFSEVPSPTYGSSSTTYDMSSIQVLKGPQGTSFGKNTTGGAVLYYPTKPNYEVEGYLEGTYGRYDDRELEGAITLPIIKDRVAVRIAGQYHKRNSYTRNTFGSGDLDDIDSQSLRLSLLLEPFDTIRNETIADYYDSDESGSAVVIDGVYAGTSLLDILGVRDAALSALSAQNSTGPRVVSSDASPLSRAMKFGVTNRTEWQMSDAVRLVNIFGYRRADIEFNSNVDGVGLLVSSGTADIPAGTPFEMVNAAFHSDVEQFSNEMQFKGDAFNGKLSWILGGFYLESEPIGPTGTSVAVATIPGVGERTIGYNFTREKSHALFASGIYDLDGLFHGLKFNAGFRYTWDEITSCTGSGITDAPIVEPSECTGGNPQILLASQNQAKSSAPTWSLGLDWQATDNVFAYITTRRGYRAGGANSPTFASALQSVQTYSPETVTDVEVGLRTDWEIGTTKLRLNASAFVGYYDDIQINVNGVQSLPGCVAGDPTFGSPPYTPDGDCNSNNDPTGGALIENAGSARFSGIDYDLQFHPNEKLSLSLGGSFLDTKTRSVDAPEVLSPFVNQSEIPFILAAEHSVFAGVAYRIPIHDQQEVALSADYYWTSERPLTYSELDSYELVNVRAVWSGFARRSMDISIFVTNLFDEDYTEMDSIASPGLGLLGTVHSAPRQYGVGWRYQFGD